VRGELLVASCRSGRALARQVVRGVEELLSASGHSDPVRIMEDVDFTFSDSETGVRLEAGVEGRDVFLLQSLYNPTAEACVDRNYLALLIAARAFREWGAAHVTALVPYLAYARQDKPTPGMIEPTTAKLLADLSAAAGIDRLITWHPHCGQIRGFYAPMPLAAPDPQELFVQEFSDYRGREDVIAVAPDAGASKLVADFGRALGLRCAIATKHRPSRGQAAITELIGDFAGARAAIVLDDMISSGGTVRELVTAIAQRATIGEIHLAASHNLCQPAALEILRELHARHRLASVAVSDSIPQTLEFLALPFLAVRPLAERFSRIVHAVHCSEPAQ
jgi:ribose-phosphate pyrophosphokinase